MNVIAVSSSVWLAVLYSGVIATAVPYFANASALARVNPSTVAVYVYLQPVFGLVMAVVFLAKGYV